MTQAHNIQVGDRVRVVKGVSIENLDGVVTLLQESLHTPDLIRALVWLDFPEPGVGHQISVPVDYLELL